MNTTPVTITLTRTDTDAHEVSTTTHTTEEWSTAQEWIDTHAEQSITEGFNVSWQASDTHGRQVRGTRHICATCGYYNDGLFTSGALFTCASCHRTFCLEHFGSCIFRLCPEHNTQEERHRVADASRAKARTDLAHVLEQTGTASLSSDGMTARVSDEEEDGYRLSLQEDGMPPQVNKVFERREQVEKELREQGVPQPFCWSPVEHVY